MTTIDQFLHHYVICALWSSNDESDESGGEPLDKNYSESDIADETLTAMRTECEAFLTANPEIDDGDHQTLEQAAHDFWLTRNHHGSGFWDGDWEEPLATKLDNYSKSVGERNLYLDDDGKIYQ